MGVIEFFTASYDVPVWLFLIMCALTGYGLGVSLNMMEALGFFVKIKNVFSRGR